MGFNSGFKGLIGTGYIKKLYGFRSLEGFGTKEEGNTVNSLEKLLKMKTC